ncbi:double-strand break repair helicase AddA [Dongia sp.]|uniref:double-strand break repair helicase AddA n=1 Tax=Dongia sp. TaxID=1977262 RepID=UPI0037531F35
MAEVIPFRPAEDATAIATRSQRRAADPAVCAWVNASAGSGKTTVLRDRVLRLLLAGARPTGILCLTFTRAAAAEMANRIATQLREWAVLDSETLVASLTRLTGARPEDAMIRQARSLFARVLDAPGGMRIETIHAFCQSLLRRFPLEAGVAPHFQLIEEHNAAELLFEAREGMLIAARARQSASLAAALDHVVGRMHESRLNELLDGFMQERDRLETLRDDRMGSVEGLRRAMATTLGIAEDLTPEAILTEACAEGACDTAALKRAIAELSNGGKTDQARAEQLRLWLHAERDARIQGFDDYADIYFTDKGKHRDRLATKAVEQAWPGITEALRAEADRIAATLERLRLAQCLADSHALAILALDILRRYTTLKAQRAVLDYDDLILKARNLMQRQGIAQWVLYKLDGGIDHILVDEAQDTNHQQWDLIKALTGEFFAGVGAAAENPDRATRTIFAVGDQKQSIFSFQGAEPEAAREVRDHYAALLPDESVRDDPRPPFLDVPLDVSFRSTGAVLKLVDAVIAGPARDGVLDPGQILAHGLKRTGQAGLVEVWPRCQPIKLDDPAPWAVPEVTTGKASPIERLAEAIAAKIAAMVGQEDLSSRGRKIRAGDIMVLVRSRDAFVLNLVRQLKAKKIAVSGIDRLRLLEDIAVMDLMAFADFLLMPEDDLNLAALLKSPLIGLGEDEVMNLCLDRGHQSVWQRLKAMAPQELFYRDAAETLGRYLARADFDSPFALFADLLGAGGGRKRIHTRLGPEADEAIDEFLNLTLRYAASNTPSLQGFLQWIRSTASIVKRELGESVDEVRIMTVHGAKGLQAPIVFLADKPPFEKPSAGLFWVAGAGTELPLWSPRKLADVPLTATARDEAQRRRREESNRLLYVALTRAEDRLYVCGRLGLKAASEKGWHERVSEAFAQLPHAFSVELENWTPPLGISKEEGWIGSAHKYTEPQDADAEPVLAKASLPVEDSELPPWSLARVAAEPDPPQPLAPSRPSEPEPATLSPIGTDQGYRFKRGLLVHRLLELLPSVAADSWPSAAERFLSRRAHGLESAQVAEIGGEVLRILQDPELAALFGPDSRAEVPVVATLYGADGKTQALTGQIDRLLVRERDCVILDYKSNRPPPVEVRQVAPAYLRQLSAYRAAIAVIYPGKSIACKILWSAVPVLMDIPATLLDMHAPRSGVTSARLDPGEGRP